MTQKIGIIGGSGLYKIEQFEIVETDKQFQKAQETIYGSPSAPIKKYKMKGVDAELFFLARHGENHHLNPSEVPYRGKRLGPQATGVLTGFYRSPLLALYKKKSPQEIWW